MFVKGRRERLFIQHIQDRENQLHRLITHLQAAVEWYELSIEVNSITTKVVTPLDKRKSKRKVAELSSVARQAKKMKFNCEKLIRELYKEPDRFMPYNDGKK